MKENIKKLTENSENILIVTDKGTLLHGSSAMLLALYSKLTKEMLGLYGVDKEILDRVYNRSFKSNDELQEELNHTLEKLKSDKIFDELIETLIKEVIGENSNEK